MEINMKDDKKTIRKNKLYELISKKVHISDTNKSCCSENSYTPGRHRQACKFLDKRFLYCDLFDEGVPDHKRCTECIETFGNKV